MSGRFSSMQWAMWLLLVVLVVGAAGCNSSEPEFTVNRIYVAKQMKEVGLDEPPAQLPQVAAVLSAMFGTPDAPYIVEDDEIGVHHVIEADLLQMAAGAVGRQPLSPEVRQRLIDQGVENPVGEVRGLYRLHCVHCHGVTGDGKGPTAAFLNPYPRDFRMGVFKFKSTPKGEKPTEADLRKTLVNGIPGTAMPSFKLLDNDEIDALINYVKYLAIRGEVERALVRECTIELGPEDDLDTSPDFLVKGVLKDVVDSWRIDEKVAALDEEIANLENSLSGLEGSTAELMQQQLALKRRERNILLGIVPARPNWDEQQTKKSIERGRELYFGTVANCIKCHGITSLGDGQTTDYDDWAKEFEDWTKPLKAEEREEKMEQYLALGGLPPRNIVPRNLRRGIYRGGRRPIDLFWRIRNGIDGAPMPAAMLMPPGQADAQGLTDEDIWHIVDYVRHLPYEPISQPPDEVLENVREKP